MKTALSGKSCSAFCIFLFVAFFNAVGFSQEKMKDYVRTNIVPIKTIHPDSGNYSDLDGIGKAIGNCTLVMLGEQDHGDASTFLAKTRLVKYLHEKKGFDVLAFESDFYGLNEGWEQLKKDKADINRFLLKNIPSVWTVCAACSNLLYDYIPQTYQTPNPLTVTGFDNQLFLNYSFYHFIPNLDSVLRANKTAIVNDPKYTSQILPLIDSSKKWDFFPPKDTLKISLCLKYLATIRKQIAGQNNGDKFWQLVIDSKISHIESIRAIVVNKTNTIDLRDMQMAANLKWLAKNKYSGKKIIIWAASRHIARSLISLKSSFYDKSGSMGERLAQNDTLREQMYILGFTCFKGFSGRVGGKPYKIFEPKKNSFETWVTPSLQYAFVDLKKFNHSYSNANESFFLSGFGHINGEARWNEIFDGIFYIRDMTPCASIDINKL